MALLRIRTNTAHVSAVTPSDLGYPIPASGGFVDLDDAEEVQSLQNSESARALLIDDVYSPEATLILVDVSGTPTDVPQSRSLAFLDEFQGAESHRVGRQYTFAIDGRVPNSGIRLCSANGLPMGSNPIIAPFDGLILEVALRTNVSDGTRAYEALFIKNGTTTIETVAYPTGTQSKIAEALTGTSCSKGDRIRVKINRTSGTGQSTFASLNGTFFLVKV